MHLYPVARVSTRRPSKKRAGPALTFGRATVVTSIDDSLRNAMQCACAEELDIVHANSLYQAIETSSRVGATLLVFSPRVAVDESRVVGAARQANPGLTVVAAVDDAIPPHDVLLKLGAVGVTDAVNLHEQEGWIRLRRLADDTNGQVGTLVTRELLGILRDVSLDTQRFFVMVARLAPRTTTVRQLAERAGLLPSSLMSRFYRASLPAPKTYLSMLRLIYAAWGFSQPRSSIVSVANWLCYSSPQSFGRHVRKILGLTATDFRRNVSVDKAVDVFQERLVDPYRTSLNVFNPFGSEQLCAERREVSVAMVAEP